MEVKVDLVVHHSGRFRNNPTISYVDGEIDLWDQWDVDYISIPVFKSFLKDHYHGFEVSCGSIYWLVPGMTLENGLRTVANDGDVCEIMRHAGSVDEIEIFFTDVVIENLQPLGRLEPIVEEDGERVVNDVNVKGSDGVRDGKCDGAGEGDDINPKHVFVQDDVNVEGSDGVGDGKGDGDGRTSPEMFDVDEPGTQSRGKEKFKPGTQFKPSPDDEYKSEACPEMYESSDDETERTVYPQFNENARFGEVTLEVGMEFPTLELFKEAIRDYNVDLGREYKLVKNDKKRVRARCKNTKCPWKVLCSWSNDSGSYLIKTFVDNHSCIRLYRNEKATRNWLAKQMVDEMRTHPQLTAHDAYNYIKEHFAVHCNTTKIYRALKITKDIVEGSEKDQYSRLWDYMDELLRTNSGSTVKLKVEESLNPMRPTPSFDRFYVCLDACRKGFVSGCRPIVGLDGCHLKGYYGGQLLAAVGLDGNNAYYVIAYAIVDLETKDTWKWFLDLLLNDIRDYILHGWEFITDQQKGLLPAMEELMPGVRHRFCVRHVWTNFCKQFKNKELRNMVWALARTTTMEQFSEMMLVLRRKSEDAWKWLQKIPPKHWTKAAFSDLSKCDNILNNNCEQFNGAIVKYRGKPILTMAEDIRTHIMRKMAEDHQRLSKYTGPITPRAQSRLEGHRKLSRHSTPIWTGDEFGFKFEVSCPPMKCKVDLGEGTCSCRVWDLCGIPCMHVIVALAYNNLKPEDYVHPYYSMETYHNLYKHHIQPVSGPEYWTKSSNQPVGPPPFKRPAGRPKKLRKTDNDVAKNPYKLKRKYGEVKCSKCKGVGHNTKTCKGVPPKQNKKKQPSQQEQGVVSKQKKQPPETIVEPAGSQGPPIASQPSQPPRPFSSKGAESNEAEQGQLIPNLLVPVRRASYNFRGRACVTRETLIAANEGTSRRFGAVLEDSANLNED